MADRRTWTPYLSRWRDEYDRWRRIFGARGLYYPGDLAQGFGAQMGAGTGAVVPPYAPGAAGAQFGPTFGGAQATRQGVGVPGIPGRLPYPDDMITAGGGYPAMGAVGPIQAGVMGAQAGQMPPIPTQGVPGGYNPYLPVTARATRTPPPGTSGPTVPVYPWGTAPASGPGTMPPPPPNSQGQAPAMPPQVPQGAGGGQQQQGSPAPPGINQKWWNDFTKEHEGQNPIEFYGATGEGLAEALADLEWSQGFAEMYGRPPTDDDWRAWWMKTRGGPTPEEIEAMREQRRKIAQEIRDETRQRPPLWVPPQTIWR